MKEQSPEVRVSPKLDGVYARVTREGAFSKSGKPLDLPHLRRRLKLHFLLRPKAELKGELYRPGLGVEKISGAARAGGAAAKPLRLHTFPDQGPRPLPIGAVRRIHAVTAKTPEQVATAYRAALAQGHEGAMIRHPDGRMEKRKPRQDAEFRVHSWQGGKRGVMRVSGGGPQGKIFKVQSRGGLAAVPGDRVTVSYSGTTRHGTPKAAVAERIRNDHDFTMKLKTQDFKTQDFKTQDARLDADGQTRKDRRTLLRGALVATGGLAGLALLARKTRGGPVGVAPYVPPVKPLPLPTMGEMARTNAVRKQGAEIAQDRALRAAELRANRAWDALPTARPFGKGLAKQHATTIAKVSKLAKGGAKGAPVAIPPAVAAMTNPGSFARMQRQRERQALREVRRARRFDTPGVGMREFKEKDRWDHTRDAAVTAGALGSGAAAIYGAREWGKTNRALRGHADAAAAAVKQVGERLQPKAIAREGVQEVKRVAKGQIKAHFPTFLKWARALKKPLGLEAAPATQTKTFATPAAARGFGFDASGLVLSEFAGGQQLIDPNDETFASPLRVLAGMQHGYNRGDPNKTPVAAAIAHKQVINAALRQGDSIYRGARRGGALGKDVADTLRGKERERDASGRTKKKEWEKQWFKNRVGKVLTGAAVLGGTAYLGQNPKARGIAKKVEAWGVKHSRRLVPDAFPSGRLLFETQARLKTFATPAGRVLDFDWTAEDAGWDVRDPRGRSARVFAPGSRGRVRREKKWHEKSANERKLWQAGLIAAGVAGIAGGTAIGRRFPQVVKPPAAAAVDNVIAGRFGKRAG